MANLDDVSQWRPLEGRAHQGARPMIPPPVDEYTGDLPPGDYALAGYSKAGFVLPGTRDIPLPLRAARAQGEHFTVSPEGNTDLGELEVYADGSLGLMLREGPDNPAWKLASSDARNDPVVAALRARVRTASVSETQDGGWIAIASGNRLAYAGTDQRWRVFDVLAGGHPQVASMAGSDAIAVGGYGPQLEWQALDGAATRLSTQGLPAGAVALLACDAQARCAIAIRALDNRSTLAWTADARTQPWTVAAELPGESCGWAVSADCSMPAQFHRMDERVVGISDGTRMVSLDLANGTLTEQTLDEHGRGSVYLDGNLIVGKRISRDGGKTWSRRAKEDDRAQMGADGKRYLFEVDAGIRFALPVLRRQDTADARWQEHAPAPAFGQYVVGRHSPRQYLVTADNLWLSVDGGQNWRADSPLIEALTAHRSHP
ncbi:MAG: hypothetical protein IPK27_10280 [Rhodanobacteraceae bacterium]|nr:hypothetical protein [Rhodanobacteraceae bacterium]